VYSCFFKKGGKYTQPLEIVGIWNPDASSLGCVSECRCPYKENVPRTVLCCVFVFSLAPNQILILHIVLTQCRKRIRGAPHAHIYIMNPAHAINTALGLFKEQKSMIVVPWFGCSSSTTSYKNRYGNWVGGKAKCTIQLSLVSSEMCQEI